MSTTLQDIAPSKIKPHPQNPRRDATATDELVASIREKGIIEPLVVAPNGGADSYVLIAGHRRLAGAKAAKLRRVPCLVRDDLVDPAAQLEVMVVENCHRADLTPIEEASAYQQLLEFPGYTIKKITEMTGRGQATVKGRLALTKLPDAVREKIHTGQVSLADALAVAEFAKDTAVVDKLTKAMGSHDFRYQLQRAKEDRERERRTARSRKQLAAEADAGVTVLDKSPSYGDVMRFPPQLRDDHLECGGLTVWMDYQGYVEYGCSKRDAHRAADHKAEIAEETQEDRERRLGRERLQAERDQLVDQLRTAGTARRGFLADVVDDRTGDDKIARDVLCRLLEYAAVSGYPQIGHEVLSVPFDPALPAAAQAVKILDRLDDLNLTQLAIALDVVLHAEDEQLLDRPESWGAPHTYSDETKVWRHRLATVYGYEWSQIELDQLAAHADAQGDADEATKAGQVQYEFDNATDAIHDTDDAPLIGDEEAE